MRFALGRILGGRAEAGQGLVEYALILALVAVLAIAGLTFLGGSVKDLLSALGDAL